MVFTGDTIFSRCQTWLMTSDVDQWLASLDIIRGLDVDHVIPGHGPVVDLSYVDTQRATLINWKAAVATAIADGWTREETAARVKFPALGPVDIGQEHMLDYVETLNAGSLYDKLTAKTEIISEYPSQRSSRVGSFRRFEAHRADSRRRAYHLDLCHRWRRI